MLVPRWQLPGVAGVQPGHRRAEPTDHDTAHHRPGLVLTLGWTLGLEETAGVEHVVAKEFPDTTMKVVAPRFGCHTHIAPRIAAEFRSKAVRLNPDFAKAHNNLGYALFKAGEYEEAIGHYEEALRIRPDYQKARNNLILAWQAMRNAREPSDP